MRSRSARSTTDGRLTTIDHPPGPLFALQTGSTIPITGEAFPKANLSIPDGSTVTWMFIAPRQAQICPAERPGDRIHGMLDDRAVRLFHFTRPGVYKLLPPHPVTMHQVITVRAPGQ